MKGISTFSDEELLSELISDSAVAFTELYGRYNRNIYQFIFKYVHSAVMADDLTQEVFIKIWNSRKHLDHVQSFKGYLLITARNHTLNSLKAALRTETAMGEVVRNFVAHRKATDEDLLDTDYAAFLQGELAKLPERSRTIFRLCRQEGRTYEEVAQELGISKSAVKNHMTFSMKVLKNSVERELGVSLSLSLVLAVILIK
jgi:RNA polymerase sigma-70 factor (family 1)